MAPLTGKTILVTGAKGGLGSFVTEALLNAGANVVGTSRSIQQKDFDNPSFTAIAAELGDAAAAQSLVDSVLQRFHRIDGLVHLVGAFAGGHSIAATDEATLDHMLEVNLRSAFRIMRAVLPHMQRQKAGRVVAVGSRAAVEPSALTGAYNASKAALVSLVKTVAVENKDAGITANVLLPGTMDTPANRAADLTADYTRWVPPGDVASLVVWLASEAGAQVNGAAIPVYGRDI